MAEHSPGTGQVLILEEIFKQFLKVDGGAMDDATATGAVSDEKTAMAMIKQIVTNSEAAVLGGNHNTQIFPTASNLTCVLAAHASANTWSAWAEVVDSAAAKLSDVFATTDGHITAMVTETANQDNTIYMIQLAYGAAKTEISAWRMASKNSFVSSTGQSAARGSHIPAGETVYARMMCATAGAKTLNVHFRHYLHP